MSHTVLVVDDDPEIREIVSEVLGSEGYTVVTANNGLEALAVLEKVQPCAVLLDMRMPVMDGWGFAKEAKARGHDNIPVVVMTAARDARTWAAEIGARRFVPKPFDLDVLLQSVGELCPR